MLAIIQLSVVFYTHAQTSQAVGNAKLDRLYTEARFAILDEEYETARQLARQAHNLAPKDPRFIHLIATSYVKSDQKNKAVEFYKYLLHRDPQGYAYLRFEIGYLYSSMNQNNKAIYHFKKAETLDFSRAVREQAYTYMKAGRHDEAIAALKRLPEQTSEVDYLCAKACFEKRDYEQAKQNLVSALNKPLSADVAQNVRDLQYQVDTAEWVGRKMRIYLTVMPQYDDNVFRDPLGPNPYAAPPSERSDFSLTTRLDFDYHAYKTEQQIFGLTAGAMNQAYYRLGEATYAMWGLGAYWNYQAGNWALRIPYKYGHYYSTSDYEPRLTSHSLMPAIYWQASQNIRAEFHGLIQRRLYITSDPDVTQLGGNAVVMYFFNSPAKYLRSNIRIDHDFSAAEDDDYTSYEFTVGGGWPIWGPLSIDIGVSYVRYQYENNLSPWMPNAGGGYEKFERHDNQWRAAVQFFCRPNSRIQLILGYYYTNNESNLNIGSGFDPYKFDQNRVSFMFGYAF